MAGNGHGGGGSAGGWVRYGLPGVVLGLALAWGLGDRGPSNRALAQGPGLGAAVSLGGGAVPSPAPAQAAPGLMPPPGSGPIAPPSPLPRGASAATLAEGNAGGTIALTTSAGGAAQFLYLIDTRARAFAVYRVDPTSPKGLVKLEAARQYQWDLKLDEYNNLDPRPAAIEQAVRTPGRSNH